MLKSVVLPGVMLATTVLLLPLHGQEAAAQTASPFVNVVTLDISPASMSKFLAALKDDGAATIKEPGTQEFMSAVGQSQKNQVFIFEIFNNSAAWDAHQKSAAYLKFIGLTMTMIKSYDIRPFSAVVLNRSTAPAPPADAPPLFINVEEVDVAAGQVDKFIDAAKSHAAASVQDPGCRAFDIAVSQTKSGHVLLFSVFDDAAAFAAHQASDHYKAYVAAAKGIILKSTAMPLSSVEVLTKGQ